MGVNKMSGENSSCASGGDRLIFACSGAADVGEIADRAARQLTRDGVGKMYCLAGVGGGIEPIVETTRSAEELLVIDGCPVACAKKLLEKAGITGYRYLQVVDLGYEKGKAPANEESITAVVGAAKDIVDGS